MLVVCGRCETEYEFDDALLSERGTTVKCTNCGYQFRVRPPKGLKAEERWVVRRAEGSQVEFGSLRDLRRAIEEGKVGVEDQLSRDGGPMRALRDVAELEALFHRRIPKPSVPHSHTLMGVGISEGMRRSSTAAVHTRPTPLRPPADTTRSAAATKPSAPAPRVPSRSPAPQVPSRSPAPQVPTRSPAPQVSPPQAGPPQASLKPRAPITPPPVTPPPMPVRGATDKSAPQPARPTHTPEGTPVVYESFSSEDRKSNSFASFPPPAPGESNPALRPVRDPALAATWTSPQDQGPANGGGASKIPPLPGQLGASTPPGIGAVRDEPATSAERGAVPASAVQFASVPPPSVKRASPGSPPPAHGAKGAPTPRSVPPPPRRVGGLRWVIGFVLVGGLALLAGTVGKDYLAQFVGSSSSPDQRVDGMVDAAWEKFRDGDLLGARADFEQASALAPTDSRVLIGIVQLDVVSADFEWLRLRLIPESAKEARTSSLQELDRRVTSLGAALGTLPRIPETAGRSALVETDALRIQGQYPVARALVQRSSFDATDPHAAYVLAMLDVAEGSPAWATVIERLRRALVSERALGRARSALVYALAASGDSDRARDELQKLEADGKPHRLSAELKAFVDTLAAGTDESVEGEEQPAAIDLDADDKDAPDTARGKGPIWLWLDQASAARRSGDLAGAKQNYGKILKESPSNAAALSGLGSIARLGGNYPEAKKYFDQVLDTSPNHIASLLGGADVRWLMGNRQGAVVLYKKIPSSSGFYSHAQRRIDEFEGKPAGDNDDADEPRAGSGAEGEGPKGAPDGPAVETPDGVLDEPNDEADEPDDNPSRESAPGKQEAKPPSEPPAAEPPLEPEAAKAKPPAAEGE